MQKREEGTEEWGIPVSTINISGKRTRKEGDVTSTPSLVDGCMHGVKQEMRWKRRGKETCGLEFGYLLHLRSIHESGAAELSPLVRSPCCQSISFLWSQTMNVFPPLPSPHSLPSPYPLPLPTC